MDKKVDEREIIDDTTWIFVRRFTSPVHRYPHALLLDGFDYEFCIAFDFATYKDVPRKPGCCDIAIVPLPCQDIADEGITLIANANKHGVMRLIAALGISRFDDRVKKAFYAMSSPLRADAEDA